MTIIKDPEGNEIEAMSSLVDFSEMDVLEIGCGDGRLTWRYAEKARVVTAIDPDYQEIFTAQANIPATLKERISFINSSLEDFASSTKEREFDLALFSWSL